MSAKRKSQESKKSTQLKTIFRASPKNILPSLEKYVKNRPDVPEICDGSMVQKMHGIVQKAVHGGTSQPSDFAGALTILQVIQHVSDFQNDPGITILLENGLLDMINAFLSALHIIRNEEETEAEKLYDNLLETIGIIADANIESRGLVVEKFCDRLLQIITSHHFSFQIRIETLKTTNMMLEGCPLAVKEQMKKSQSHRELMRHVAHLMPNAGDYEFQVGLTECLFRMTHKADRADFAKKWFDDEEFLDAFLGIRDSDFDTDCRKFLLLVNAIENGETSVITIPANLVLLGKYKLRKPNDANYDAFWVDFNSQSRRILVFCDPDPSESQDAEDDHLWETVAIQDENVVQYAILESSGMIEVTIELNSSAMELISFGPNSSSKTVTLYFDSNCDLKNALVSTFGSGKLKQTSKKMKSSTARIPVDLQTDQFKVPKAAPSEAPRREQPQKQGEMIPSSQDSAMSAPRVKVSVPSVAMRICTNHTTPVLTVPHVRQSTKSQNDSPKGLPTPPKTPVQKTNTSQKKVKTPLQFTKPSPKPTTESADAMSAKGDSTSRVAARQPVRNTRKTSEKHMEEPTESQTVIPSSMPGEDFQDSIDTLHSLPALSTRKSKRHNRTQQIDDSGVCLDLTKEAPDVSRVSHDDPKQTKKQEMSELKERLEMSDPDYCILPKNTHKVSTTPALSTVTEESVTGSIKTKDRIKKDFQMLANNETITEIPEESNSQSVQPSIEEIKETVNVNRFYSKTPQKQQMSPDSTSQSLCDNHSSNIVEVCLPPGMEINPEEYNRDSLKESKPKTNKRHSKKEPTFPDSSTTTSRPRTRSRSNVRISPKMSQDRICEVIPETQLTPVESFDIQESNQKKQTRRSGCHTTEKNSTSGLEGNRRLSSPIATGNEPLVQKSVEVSKAQTEDNWSDDDNFNLTIEDSCKEQDERVDTSIDLTNTSNAPKSYSRKNTPLKSTTLKKSVEKSKPEVVSVTKPKFFKSRLLNFSNEDKDQLNRPTCVYEFEPHVKPKGKPQTSKTKAKKPKEITNKETSPKNAVNEKEEENVEKRPAHKNNSNKNKDINKSIASPEAVEANISTNLNESNRFDELVQSMIKRSPCAKNRSVRARKQVNYKEPAESEVGSEYDMTPAVTTKRQNVNIDPYALDIPPDQQVKKKGKKKRSLFSENDETTDAKSEVSWLGSTAKKRKPKVQKTYVYNRGNKRGRLVTAKAYHRDDPVDFHIDDSDNESVEIEKPAPPPKKKRKTKAKKVDDDDKENMVENLYFGASRTNTGTDVESLLPEFQIEDEPVLKTPNRGKQKPGIDINALFSGLGLPGTKTPRTPFKELSLNRGDWSIERCRREAPDMLPSVSQLVISPTDGPKMTSSPVNKDNLDNDGVDEEFQLDLGSQLSTCTHISTLKTPKTPKHPGKSDKDKDDDDDDYEELLAECDPLEEPSIPNLLQSGPSKRTRVEQKQEMRGDIIENPDSCTDAEAVNVNAAESDVEDEDEEDEDDDDQGLAALNRSTLRPRRLFSEIMSDYKNAMTTNEKCTDDDDEEEEMADDEQQEMGVNEEQEQESDDSDEEEEKVMMPDELKLQSGVSTLLHSFGSEITKNLFAKKNQLEEMTKDLIQTSHHQLNNVWLKEYRHRDRLMDEFKKAVLHELMELEKDVDKLRQAEDKIMVFFKEQQFIMNTTCSSQKLRLQNMVKIENAFIKDMTSTAPLVRQETSSRDILKKQMMTLQKKILHQAQQQEIQNVKRSLQNLFV